MADPPQSPSRFSLRRWSQRKLEASRNADAGRPALQAPATGARDAPRDAEASRPAAEAGTPAVVAPAPAAPATHARIPEEASPLPAIESLSIDSDFSPFMQPGVDEDLKRSALRKLMRDPRFNVMDGLDVYIDDYSKPDPIDPAVVRTLMQARYIFDPPKTRVNAEGHVEDVPIEDLQANAEGAAAETTAGAADAGLVSTPVAELPPPDAAAAPPAVATKRDVAGDPAPLQGSKST